MMAAIRAAERGKKVTLLEKNPGLGKKLLITGGGRCNVTNHTLDNRSLLTRYGDARDFLFSAFAQYSVADTISFFKERGVELKIENEGRMFPRSDSARTIYDALMKALEKSKVTIRTSAGVLGIRKGEDGVFSIELPRGEVLRAKTVVLATGGMSRPETGSTGEGFSWLRSLGHVTKENNFALVPIALSDEWVKTLGGVTLASVKLTLRADGVRVVPPYSI
jgi:predicted Rossmann fold flavoprotein